MVGSGQCLPHAYTKSSLVRHGGDPGIVFDETKRGIYQLLGKPWYLGYYPPPWENIWSKMGMIMLKAFIRSSAKKDMICMNCMR